MGTSGWGIQAFQQRPKRVHLCFAFNQARFIGQTTDPLALQVVRDGQLAKVPSMRG